MSKLKGIAIIAGLSNLLTIILYFNAANQPGGTGAALVFSIFWMPLIWCVCLSTVLILSVMGRKYLFKRALLKWSLPALLFSTPIPLTVLYTTTHYSSVYQVSEGYNPHDGYTYKDEEWVYTSNRKLAVHKFFKLNTEDYQSASDSLFKKDSVWVYLNTNGDTAKVEKYHEGKLISSRQVKQKK